MWESYSITIWIFPNLYQWEGERKEIRRGIVKATSIVLRESKKEERKIVWIGEEWNAISDWEGGGSQAKAKEETDKDKDQEERGGTAYFKGKSSRQFMIRINYIRLMLVNRITRQLFSKTRKQMIPKPPKLLSGELLSYRFDAEDAKLFDGYDLE